MPLKSSHRSGSPATLCLILLLSIAFLVPLYHSHDHAADHHPENSIDHVLLYDESVHDGLSADQQHNGSHLHIKKDIAGADTHLQFKSRSQKPDLSAVTELRVLAEHHSFAFEEHAQTSVFRSNSYDCPSGLSPPTA